MKRSDLHKEKKRGGGMIVLSRRGRRPEHKKQEEEMDYQVEYEKNRKNGNDERLV